MKLEFGVPGLALLSLRTKKSEDLLSFVKCGMFLERQSNLKARISRLRLKANIPAVLSNDARDRIEPEPGSFTDRLRRKKWLEDARLRRFRYSRTVIANFDHDVSRFSLGANLKLPTLGHRIHGVDYQIRPNLVEFTAVGLDVRQVFSVIACHADILLS